MLIKLFHEIEREGTLPNSFYEARITLIPKLDKDPTIKKLQTNLFDDYRHKNLSKILAIRIQQHIKT
jgi:hypothetical protein